MPAYLIGRMNIVDPDAYEQYKTRTPELIARHGGRFLARGGAKVTVEGQEENRRVVIAEFPSTQAARAFYESTEYQAARALRGHAATDMQIVIVEGFE